MNFAHRPHLYISVKEIWLVRRANWLECLFQELRLEVEVKMDFVLMLEF